MTVATEAFKESEHDSSAHIVRAHVKDVSVARHTFAAPFSKCLRGDEFSPCPFQRRVPCY